MKSWMRIIIAVFILIGGAVFFRHWSLSQFNNAFDNLSASYAVSIPQASSVLKNNFESASTSPEVASTTLLETPTTVATSTVATSTNTELSLTFPQKGNRLYIGCTYQISWQSSTTVNSLEMALIDAGTIEAMGPIASGLAKENTIKKDPQILNWKVGSVWPGEYYIKISKINGVKNETRSRVFLINKVPNGLSDNEREDICKKSDE